MRRKVDPRHDLLGGPLATGDALLGRGGHGASEHRLVIEQGVIAGGDGASIPASGYPS